MYIHIAFLTLPKRVNLQLDKGDSII